MTLITAIGWLGTLFYLANHAYISLNKNWKKHIYYGGNAIAAGCLVLSSFYNQSWQAVVINSFWLVISAALLMNANLHALKFSPKLFYIIVGGMMMLFAGGLVIEQQANLALLGWVSAVVFSGCYLLFSQEKMLPRFYLCWNAFAAIALLPQLWLDANWPVFGLEIAWALISIYGAVRRFEEVHLID